MSTPLLSLCCGALPLHGIVNERFGHRTGHCGECKGHTTFAPGGVVEGGVPFLRLPPLHTLAAKPRCQSEEDQLLCDVIDELGLNNLPKPQRQCQLSRIDRHAARGGWVAWLCVVGTALALLLLFWGSWRKGQVERGERSPQGVVEQDLGGAHGGSLPEEGAR